MKLLTSTLALFFFSLVSFLFSQPIDTTHSVPGLTQYYDYVTNGNNLKKIWASGDTVIITGDFTDSLNARTPTARRTLYQFSNDGGQFWQGYVMQVSDSNTAYPDMVPVLLSGRRTVTISGIGTFTGGYSAVDFQLGVSSFTISGIPPPGGGTVISSPIAYPNIACTYARGDSLFFRKYNYSTNLFSSAVLITLLQSNPRYYIATSSNGQNVFIMWWNSSPAELKARESTDSGNTFGPVFTVISNTVTVNGTQVSPWYAADVVYKPGTTQPFVAASTLDPNMNPTATGSKVIMWSPGINGGQPVRIADWSNMLNTFISDTAGFNNNLRNIQVGMTPISHPSIAFSDDGSYLVCAFSTVRRDTSVYGYNFNSVYGSYSTNNGNSWVNPATFGCVVPESETTCPWCDQIYPSLSKTGNTRFGFHLTYSLSTCPGSASFTDVGTPVCKVYQMYDKFCPEPLPGVVINTSVEIPKSYSLSQNFPNPFNPSTLIRFDIVKASEVKISVYDVTGKEVTRLVQQKLDAGKYSVDFDAGNLASGVYFYSIIAGDPSSSSGQGFVQTKKMVLVK